MANETVSPPASPPEGQSVTGLVSGIIQDAQELFKQQVALAKAEIKADFHRTVRAATALAVGAAFAVLAAVLIVAGVRRFQSFNPLPDQTVEAFKENVRWMTNPK